MSKPYLDPRTVESDAPRRWKKENLDLLKRLGVVNIALVCAVLALPALALGWVCWKQPVMALPLIPIAFFIGLVLTGFQINVLERARRGLSASIWEDLAGALSEVGSNGKWFKTSLLKILLLWTLLTVLIGLMAFLTTLIPTPGEAQENASPPGLFDYINSVSLYMTLYILALRPNGFMSMSYFLVVKLGVERDVAEKLEKLGDARNMGVLGRTSLFIIFSWVTVILISQAVSYFVIPMYILASLFFNGLNLSAWHDIYDPDGGLAEEQTVRDLHLARIPA